MAARDRRLALLGSATTNGVDFVEVASADQTKLRVHFLNAVSLRGHLAPGTPVTITGGEVIQTVPVNPVDEATAWSADSSGRPVLSVSVPAPGDFSLYTLTVSTVSPAETAPVLDPFLDAVTFTFKVNCPATVGPDGTAGPAGQAALPGQATTDPAIDYLAKDFASFRRALSDFSALKYPQWVERSEADLGVVLMEALCAVADDLSYYQDRVAAEASLDTATQAVSVLRHARLVDYEPRPATVASVLLQLEVAGPVKLALAQPSQSGLLCSAHGPDGQAVPFEAGGGLADPVLPGVQLDPHWNRYRYVGGARQIDAAGNPVFNLLPYWWDDDDQVLPASSTQLWLAGTGFGLFPGQQLVLDTDGPTSADSPVRELITVSGGADAPQETEDYLFGTAVTRVTFTPALAFDHDQAVSRLAGNLVGAVQGVRTQETFAIPPVPAGTLADPAPAPVVVRIGHDWNPDSAVPDYRYTLGGGARSAAGPLSWLPGSSGTPTLGDAVIPARPDLVLTADDPDGTQVTWPWCRSLLDVVGQEQGAPAFTLTPERYSPVAVIDGMTCFDYDGDDGTTIRFGDGVFGQVPAPGTRFTVSYRAGVGLAGNVPADTITAVAAGQAQASVVLACTNPFPAAGGADAQTLQQVADTAPEQFRAQLLCVVRPEDYVAAAQSLPWVAQAGSVFRWTGSWLSAYTTADPATSEQVSAGQLAELTALLNRQRLAGYASYVLSPRYLSIDLQVTVLAEAGQFRGNVEAAVLARLRPGRAPDGTVGFFDHSRWRFGMLLQWSTLAAAIQAIPGVAGVLSIGYRLRGVQAGFSAMPDTVTVAPDQILRADDDPSRPEAGSVTVIVEGGK